MPQHEVAIVGKNNNKALVSGQGALAVEMGDKMSRIKNSTNYTRTFTYATGTSNITSIVHTGLTSQGTETITETISYVDETVDGSNITQIQYS